jgi:hypothetical protein
MDPLPFEAEPGVREVGATATAKQKLKDNVAAREIKNSGGSFHSPPQGDHFALTGAAPSYMYARR